MYEVLIVGGGPAGLSAALILGRCRRRVLVCDSNRPRNMVTAAVHGFLTRDGIAPEELRRLGREQLGAYETVEIRETTVVNAQRMVGGFEALLDDGQTVQARKLLIATGVADVLPDVPGLRELYGRAVFHCPYCDGWEVRDRPIAVYGRDGGVAAEARALTRYSRDIVICTDGDPALATSLRAELGCIGVTARDDRVIRLEPREHGLAVVFDGGDVLDRGALFFCSTPQVRSALAERLGCVFSANGLVETSDYQSTGVSGVYVAGDASRSVLLAIVAAGEGATAAFAINRELLREEPDTTEGRAARRG